jgi:hypothetical protein
MSEQEIFETIQHIQSLGYAVVVFTPRELHGVDPTRVEDLLVQRGKEIISSLH